MGWTSKKDRESYELRISELEAEVRVLKRRYNEHVRETYRPHLVPEGVYEDATIEAFDKIQAYDAAGAIAFKRSVRLRLPQYTTPVWATVVGSEVTLTMLEHADWTNVRLSVRVMHREYGTAIAVHILDVA